MLIASHRHTAKDLELWAEYEAADLVHGQSSRMKELEQVALHELAKFAAAGPCYCSISWGKDSVVVGHLWWRLFGGARWCFWHARPLGRMPETELIEAEFLKQFPLLYQRIEVHGDWAVPEYERISGATRYATGVRADESGSRKISARYHGKSTSKACRPILWWDADDVFGYLAAHELPVHPAYAMLGYGRWERQRLRVETVGGEDASNYGRAEWEREYYGDVLRRIEANRPLK